MKKFYPIIITGSVCLLTGIAIGWGLLQSGTKRTDIKWKFGNNELDINLDQDLINFSAMLSKIFSEDFSREGAIEWLKVKQQLYHPKDPDIIAVFSGLEYEDLVAKELRVLSVQRKGPWAYQLDTITIGVPEGKQPPKGFANVCENGKYFTKKIRLLSMDHQKMIEVEATGKYACPQQLKYPDIQLNPSDAKALLGTFNFFEI